MAVTVFADCKNNGSRPRGGGDPCHPSPCSNAAWIPAYAGMTGCVRSYAVAFPSSLEGGVGGADGGCPPDRCLPPRRRGAALVGAGRPSGQNTPTRFAGALSGGQAEDRLGGAARPVGRQRGANPPGAPAYARAPETPVDPQTPPRPDDPAREAGAASVLTDYVPPGAPPDRDRVGLHVGLFLATFASTVWAGGALAGRNVGWPRVPLDASAWTEAKALASLLADPTFLTDGFLYAVPFLLFLTVHEFGHYTAARVLKTRVSLPYYIPLGPLGFGTLGAVIRIREPLRRTRQLFDIGAAGPLAGFVVALGALVVGALTLPPPEYLLSVLGHESVVLHLQQTGAFPPFDPAAVEPGSAAFVVGDTPLFHLVNGLGYARVPVDEVIHYPVLLAGWLGLFFTALNLLPVGQLDGGHVVYALFGPAVHGVVARVTTLLLLLSGGVGLVGDLAGAAPAWQVWVGLGLVYALALAKLFEGDWRLVGPGVAGGVALVAVLVLGVPALAAEVGWTGWLVWVGLILFVIRVDHPPVLVREPLTPARKALGYLCLLIFALCFSIQPIQLYAG